MQQVTRLQINYDAIRALNANGHNVQSNDGQVWHIVHGKGTMAIKYHINFNGTLSGPYDTNGNKLKI